MHIVRIAELHHQARICTYPPKFGTSLNRRTSQASRFAQIHSLRASNPINTGNSAIVFPIVSLATLFLHHPLDNTRRPRSPTALVQLYALSISHSSTGDRHGPQTTSRKSRDRWYLELLDCAGVADAVDCSVEYNNDQLF